VTALLSGLIPYLIAAVGALGFLLAAYARGRVHGAQLERSRQTEAVKKAIDEAQEIQNDVGAMPPGAARKELGKWSR
jgi:hypothetical protein